MSLFSELRRRNVLRMAVLYVVGAWLIMQVAEVIITLADLPTWSGQLVLAVLAVGFPIALIFSWFYELTPEGIALEKDVDRAESITHVTGRHMDFVVIAMLCAALLLFAYDKWWPEGPMEQSIAVLAFDNLSDDPEQEYFSDGVSEEILNLLAQIKPLKVIARTSSFSFKGKDADVATIAEKLNVSHVLEGSVRRTGDHVRITAQLIDAADSTHAWSQTYDRELGDVFAIQDEIATEVGNALRVQFELVAGEPIPPTSIKSASTLAYDAYLEGRELFRRRGHGSVEAAIAEFERALLLDEAFAPAHAQLAIATAKLFDYELMTSEELERIAVPHLDRAQELEPDLAEAYVGRALLESDHELSIEHLRQALAANPSYSYAMNVLYVELHQLGRYQEAEVTLKQMLVIDPLLPIGRWNYAWWLARKGRVADAHELADQLISEGSRTGYSMHADAAIHGDGNLVEAVSWSLSGGQHTHGYLMLVFMIVGEYEEARRLVDRWIYLVDLFEGHLDEYIPAIQEKLRQDPENRGLMASAAIALFKAGRVDEALPLYEQVLDSVPEGRPVPGSLGHVHTMYLALARRHVGDENGVRAAVEIVRQDLAALRAVGFGNHDLDVADAMIAAFESRPDGVISALRSALRKGLRNPLVLDGPAFDDVRDDPRFVALREELDVILAVEREKILQLICFNNPVPDDWQPLPETCEGVVEAES